MQQNLNHVSEICVWNSHFLMKLMLCKGLPAECHLISNICPKNLKQKYQEWCSEKGFGCVCHGHCGSVHDGTREHEGVRAAQCCDRHTHYAGEKQPALHFGAPNMNSICGPHNTSGCIFTWRESTFTINTEIE